MISAEHAISCARRDLTLGALLKGLLMACAAGSVILGVLVAPLFQWRFDPTLALALVGAVWFGFLLHSAKNSRQVAESQSLIASGQFAAAERLIGSAMRSFSMFRAVKLLGLHHLAALRHAQRRWQDAALLCRALLAQPRVEPAGLGRSTRLLLADALLELGDVSGAGDCLIRLYGERLPLGEAMTLLGVQLDYESRIGAWPSMLRGITTKVSLAELLPTGRAARAQALLALAARKEGREDWTSWLRARVELLVDPVALVVQRPLLRDLWPES